ncbi:pro-epidermal growth factor isoform X1 [Osmerus eperlanus]|uniref:pro-epidermal growth factor isoform X1 n=2 Tax=Osmerus eperlanus TaxID=29151 RepID=UPI002E150AD3
MFLATVVALLVCFSVRKAEASEPGRECWSGSVSGVGSNWSCVEPYLIFGHGKAIYRMDLDGGNRKRLVAGVGNSILLDFNYKEGRVYWADRTTGVVYKAAMDGAQRQKLYSSEKGLSGLAVDWIQNVVFWSSEEKGTIKRMEANEKNERTVLRYLSQPCCIAIDPSDRFLFWLSDGITPSIQRSNMAGEMTTTVLKMAEKLRALSIDRTDKRLFWVQFGSEGGSAIGSCDYNGNVINTISQPLRSQSLGIFVFMERVYYTDAASRAIKQVNKYTGGAAKKINRKRMAHPPIDVKVVHPLNQPIEDPVPVSPGCDGHAGPCVNVCSNPTEQGLCQCSEGFALSKHGNHCEDINECALWSHGCSLGCENVPGSYFCSCPQGYALLPDRRTCQETFPCEGNMTQCDRGCVSSENGPVCVCSEGSTLLPDGLSCSGCSSADRGGCSQLCSPTTLGHWECKCVPGYRLHQDGRRCSATGPAPYLLFANTVDVRRVNLDGSGDHRLLDEPQGNVIALDYDPVQNKVYFASTTLRKIERVDLAGGSREVVVREGLDSPEGLAVDWVHRRLYWTDRGLSTIERSTLNGLDRETVIRKGIHAPRGIAVHPLAKKLFWTDMGRRPAVLSAALDGRERWVVADSGLAMPCGLALDFLQERVFWGDSSTGALESANLDGSERRLLTENEVGRPFDLAVFEDRVWVSDRERRSLGSFDKRSGEKLERIHGNVVQPASIVVVHPMARPGADMCLHQNGGCSQVCESRLGRPVCSCFPHYQPSQGDSCVPISTSSRPAESGDWGESVDPFSLKNKTLNDESMPLPLPGLSSDGEEADAPLEHSREPALFTEKMVSDQDDCSSLRCDVNARCLVQTGSATCICREGFSGDGDLCVDVDECEVGVSQCSVQSSECVNTAGGYYCQCRPGFTGDGHHCTDVDECSLGSHRCDEKAECVNSLGKYLCRCQAGYSGHGPTCQETQTKAVLVTTRSPVDPTIRGHQSVEGCPSSHDSYCLYEGTCFYFPEMQSYACNCVSGYMGERCQFSDLQWWDLQQAEQEKRRNVAIAACMAGLITLLSIAACITYCYGSRSLFREHLSVDDMSVSSSTDETTPNTTSPPRFYVVLDAAEGQAQGCPVRAVCPSCTPDTAAPPPPPAVSTQHSDQRRNSAATELKGQLPY